MTQSQAIELMLQGSNIFLTGAPGSGKSYVIDQFVRQVRTKNRVVALTATTGIAASLIEGITIHSWSGLGINRELSSSLLAELLANNLLVERLKITEILIIDEISMLDGQMLDNLNLLLKRARDSKKPFGGLQVILSGDFFQLPPVSSGLLSYGFDSSSWSELELVICYLTDRHRQVNDELYAILSAMREKRLNRSHLDLLMARQNLVHSECTRLMTHNIDVDAINSARLAKIKGKERRYQLMVIGQTNEAQKLIKSILAPEELVLKIGAQVMFVANDFSLGFANGTQGKVVAFKGGFPVVEIDSSGSQIKVEPHSWKYVLDNKVVAEILQLPLRLAWAITIHKSQGMSLDEADIDLTRSFTYGMGYVALSRLRSYEGLYLRGINSRSLQLDTKIYDFDQQLRTASGHLAVEDVTVTEIVEPSLTDELRALVQAGASSEFIKISLGINSEQLKQGLKQLNNIE